MEHGMLTLEKFEEASEVVKKVTQETKLVYSDFYSAQTGGKVYLKPENMQFTGAYKLRGAYYKLSTLSDQEREKGLITASAGNHAQGVAYAATVRRWFSSATCMTRHASMLLSSRQRTDIPLSIPSTTRRWLRAREP